MASEREISEAVAGILADAEADIAGRKPVCKSSGRCCKFEEYGHRMYVTGAELVHFTQVMGGGGPAQAGRVPKTGVSLPQFFAQAEPKGCPYQVEGLCTAREARPLGCRVYFCDANAQGWQSDVYEKYHGQLQALHERVGLKYRYVEWRQGLREWASGDLDGD